MAILLIIQNINLKVRERTVNIIVASFSWKIRLASCNLQSIMNSSELNHYYYYFGCSDLIQISKLDIRHEPSIFTKEESLMLIIFFPGIYPKAVQQLW